MSNYTRTIYNLDIGFVVRFKVDNVGFILKNKVELFYTNFIGVYNDIHHFVNDENTPKPINEKDLINVILKYSRDTKVHMYLSEKPYNTKKNINEFLSKFSEEQQKVVIKFDAKSSKYISKRLP